MEQEIFLELPLAWSQVFSHGYQFAKNNMNVEEFKTIRYKELDKLIPCRKVAYDNAKELRVKLFNNKFWDLFALYNNQWHYISTIKTKLQ